LSLDELIVLYEATCERQGRISKIMAASMGAEINDDDNPYKFLYSDSESNKPDKKYQNPLMVDPKKGGEITPVYGKDEVGMLPINLGYSIIEKQD
jgi:hypothetical protein